MSISSLLDSGPGKSSRDLGGGKNGNGSSPTGHFPVSLGPSFPPALSPTRPSNGETFFSRSSPDKHQNAPAPTSRSFRAYSGGASERAHTHGNAGSPDGPRFGSSPANPSPRYSPTSESGRQQEWKSHHDRNSNMGRLMSRPSSQPNGNATSPLDPEKTKAGKGVQDAEKAKQEENDIREASLRQANRDQVSSFDFLGRHAQIERQKRLREHKSIPQGTPQEDRVNGMNYPFLTQNSVFSEPSISAPQSEKETVIDRLLERSYQPNAHASTAPGSEESLHRLHDERQKLAQQTQRYSPVASRRPLGERQIESQAQNNSQTPTLSPENPERRVNVEGFGQQLRNGDEGLQNHRSMLALINDNTKRAGRVSPLPQAVQGAQGQRRGPSSDPSISNEFSRMFAGIGSGVGSTGLNSGASTPFPPSPKQNSEADQRIPFNGRGDLLSFAKSRNGSRVGKRGKRVKEDDTKDLEIIEDRSTSGMIGARANKKSRVTQPHHHHINK